MKTAYFLLAVLLLANVSSGAVLKVASDGTQPYSQVTTAIAAASSGDTVLVMAGTYTGFTVDRKLVIIGAGTGIGIGEGVMVNGAVEVLDAADSTEIRSLWLRAGFSNGSADSLAAVLRLRSGVTRVFVWRCFVENTHASSSAACVWLGNAVSADLIQCVLWYSGGTDATGRFGLLYRSNTSITMSSCVFSSVERGLYQYPATTGTTALIKHCVFTAENSNQYPVSGSVTGVIENCAFIDEVGYTQYHATGMSYSYCAWTNQAPPGATNFQTTLAAFVIMNLMNARSSDYHLAAGSNLIDAGNPGSPNDLDNSRADIGIYGGQHPYVEGGVPDYPFAVQVEVPYSAPLNGTMRIWGRGRVGPGY